MAQFWPIALGKLYSIPQGYEALSDRLGSFKILYKFFDGIQVRKMVMA